MPDNNTDWGLKKEYLHSTRKNLWNNDYFEFLVKGVWKIDKPVRIIDFGCGYGYLAARCQVISYGYKK